MTGTSIPPDARSPGKETFGMDTKTVVVLVAGPLHAVQSRPLSTTVPERRGCEKKSSPAPAGFERCRS
jgi:hypothetical protein